MRSTTSNDSTFPYYNRKSPSWANQTYTFDGSKPTQILINDKDARFEDGYVESCGPANLAEDVTIYGTTYLAGSVIENELSLIDSSGNEVWVHPTDGEHAGFVPTAIGSSFPTGSNLTSMSAHDHSSADSADGISTTTRYDSVICFFADTLIETPTGPGPPDHSGPATRF